MNKKMFRYFYVLLILFIAINISFISASEIDQGNDAVSTQISSDEIGVDEVLQDGEGCSTDTNPVETDTPGCSTDTNNPINENDGNGDDSGNDETPEEITLEKTSLSSVDYAIKNKYLNVYLKDSSKNAIANQKVTLTINGKTLSA
ncbi:MAG: hypothetical protein J6W71_08130, partial [Methanobrevibacter sp.]|nr:hypothetical protein [Methanobrevibacter sp.]